MADYLESVDAPAASPSNSTTTAKTQRVVRAPTALLLTGGGDVDPGAVRRDAA